MREVFLNRLYLWEKINTIREDDPLWMFPWKRSVDYFESKILANIPPCHILFKDALLHMGNPNQEEIRLQTTKKKDGKR